MLALLEHSPDIYLDELQEQLEEQHNIKCDFVRGSRFVYVLVHISVRWTLFLDIQCFQQLL